MILIEGGPGTGKSVIALEAFAHAVHDKRKAFLVSGSSAFTSTLRRLVGSRLEKQVQFTDFFWRHRENALDLLIIDEAHRIRAHSGKGPKARGHKISQLQELVRSAKVVVLFTDENQIIDPSEVGYVRAVKKLAKESNIRFSYHQLHTQFRCNGSGEYLHWCDNLFGLTTSNEPPLLVPTTFDFGVLDSPRDLLAWIVKKNAVAPNSARILGGWCWPWSNPREDGTLVKDIRIGAFAFPWERKSRTKAKPGTPEARYWAVHPNGAKQAGTVYSAQGFEFPRVGILMGPDLRICNGTWVASPRDNYKRSLKRLPPEDASLYFRRIYRALFTRALVSVRVFSVDSETRKFLRSRLTRPTRFRAAPILGATRNRPPVIR